MNKPTLYRADSTLPNTVYRVDDVQHIACSECMPDMDWIQGNIAAGRLKLIEPTTVPCEFCGGYTPRPKCNCYVKGLPAKGVPEHERFVLRYGAHHPTCPVYRVSRDPVDAMNDKIIRNHYTGE